MSLSSFVKWISAFGIYKSEDPVNATQDSTIVGLLENNNTVLGYFVKNLWQASDTVTIGQIKWSPNMPDNTFAKVKTPGTTGTVEPTWTAAGTELNDNGVIYNMLNIAHELASSTDATAGTDTHKIMTPATTQAAINAAKANTVLTGNTKVETLTVSTVLNIPGGKIWIE